MSGLLTLLNKNLILAIPIAVIPIVMVLGFRLGLAFPCAWLKACDRGGKVAFALPTCLVPALPA